MKRFLVVALILSMVLCAVAYADTDYSALTDEELATLSGDVNAEIQARKPASDPSDFIYASNGSQVQINAYVGNGGDVVIPDEIDGIPVTRIGNGFLDNDRTVKSITLPQYLTTIGNDFAFCSDLSGVVVLPKSMTSIGNWVMSGSHIKGVVIQSDVRIGYRFIRTNNYIEFVYIRPGCNVSFVYDDGHPSIEESSTLRYAIIPDSVTSIPKGMFLKCPKLTIITPAGSAAQAYAKENWIACNTKDYDEYVAYYEALYPAD